MKKKRVGKIRELKERMSKLMKEEPINSIFKNLIKTKLDLNMEIDKMKLY